MATQRITLNPEPPKQGKEVEICYDFSGSGITETTLRVRFSPGSGPSDHEVSETEPCVTVSVPSNATSVEVDDVDGPSLNKYSQVDP